MNTLTNTYWNGGSRLSTHLATYLLQKRIPKYQNGTLVHEKRALKIPLVLIGDKKKQEPSRPTS